MNLIRALLMIFALSIAMDAIGHESPLPWPYALGMLAWIVATLAVLSFLKITKPEQNQ